MTGKKARRAVAFVIAHPDDLEFSMGGTAWKLRDDHDLHVICATRGSHGVKGTPPEEAGAIRTKEQEAACEILGAELTFLDETDGRLYAGREVCEEVADILKRLAPVALFTLWPVNEHPDHVAVFDIAVHALRIAGLYGETEVYMSENAIGMQTNQFDPDIYVDISDVVEIKRELGRCHRSQNRGDRLKRRIERNRFRGMVAGCDYAEGFKTMYPLTANGPRGRAALLLGLGRARAAGPSGEGGMPCQE